MRIPFLSQFRIGTLREKTPSFSELAVYGASSEEPLLAGGLPQVEDADRASQAQAHAHLATLPKKGPVPDPSTLERDVSAAFTPSAELIGAILVESGRLTHETVQRVIDAQAQSGERFGEAGRRLGVIDESDVHYALARQFAFPCLRPGDNSVDQEVLAAFQPTHELVERLRILRGHVLHSASAAEGRPQTLAIVSVERGAGRSFLAANLATVFAQLGHNTLLIDGDLIQPRLHRLFHISNRAGLSSVLAQRATLETVRHPVAALPSLGLLPTGPLPPNAHDLYARPGFSSLLRECERLFDIVILDTPAWSDGSGALMATAAAGSAVLVLRKGATRAHAALQLSQDIAGVRAKILGAVFNRY